MQISAAGNEATRPVRRHAGFTLIELLVVMAIAAVASAGVLFTLRDDRSAVLEREAQRLVALLDSARAQSRLSGVPVFWRATPAGFRFEGLNATGGPDHWLDPRTRGDAQAVLTLGPEPIIGAQGVELTLADAPGLSAWVHTDGLRPFQTSLRTQPP